MSASFSAPISVDNKEKREKTKKKKGGPDRKVPGVIGLPRVTVLKGALRGGTCFCCGPRNEIDSVLAVGSRLEWPCLIRGYDCLPSPSA